MPDASPIVRVTTQEDCQPIGLHLPIQQKFMCVSISDNGIGFEQSEAEKIFNVFTRLHGNSEYKGTGVGLSIVRKVMQNHNGFVQAEAAPNQGSRFRVFFPIEPTL